MLPVIVVVTFFASSTCYNDFHLFGSYNRKKSEIRGHFLVEMPPTAGSSSVVTMARKHWGIFIRN
jgi:hypothetical protein